MRVLQVIGSMNRGGAESMIMNLYRNIDREKVQFDFIESTNDEAAYDCEILSLGGKIYHCPHYTGKNHFRYEKWWNNFFEDHKGEYQIIHGHIGSTASLYLLKAKKNGLFTIAHSHSTKMGVIYSAFSYPTRYIADFFFGCSKIAGEYRYGKKICSDMQRFRVLNNAIDSDIYRFSPQVRYEVLREFGIDDSVVVGTVGRLNQPKNPDGIIDIIKALQSKAPNTKFMWVGDGDLREIIKERLHNENLSEYVIMTGVRDDVHRLMQAMDAFILPSLYEGLPVVAIEAQAAGLQCFLSDTVTDECSITDRCRFLPLSQPETWANSILSADLTHTDTKQQIIESGYDVHTTAMWLEDFYLNLANNRS